MEHFPTVSAETERQSTIGAQPRPIRWRTAGAGAWLAGVAFMLIRLAVGWYRLRRICLAATPASERQARHNLDGHRLPVRLTRQLHGPVCFGLFRPVVLLPEEMYEGGTPESLRMVLTHELAHLERRDAWVNLFQRLVEAVYFFHPFVWWASRQLTQQREQICDNYVLAEGVSPADYTTLLSQIGEQAVWRGIHRPWPSSKANYSPASAASSTRAAAAKQDCPTASPRFARSPSWQASSSSAPFAWPRSPATTPQQQQSKDLLHRPT